MADQDNKHQDQFNASLPLPMGPKKDAPTPRPTSNDTAAELIRKKVEAAYETDQEPSAQKESQEVLNITDHKLSKHQRFIFELTSSGKPLQEVNEAWHEYYQGLNEPEKHEVWNEFYTSNSNISKDNVSLAKKDVLRRAEKQQYAKPLKNSYSKIQEKFKIPAPKKPAPAVHRPKAKNAAHSLVFGLSVGLIVMTVLMFSFFNERFVAPFIQPSRNVSNTPIISSTAPISSDPEIIIPKINVQIPVVYDIATIDEAQVEAGLENGVVHYADTAMPGQNGNVVIVGHSSNNIFNPGKYKFAFVLLSRMEIGDTFFLQKDGKRYTYQIYDKKIVKPTDVSVLSNTPKPASATLITCDPPGTSANRLVVVGEQIDPSPIANNAAPVKTAVANDSVVLPGNSPSLWSRIWKWLSY